MQITCHGAAREVTGSCHQIFHNGVNVLFDCGMFQGGREAFQKNRAGFGFKVEDLDAVVISHAHIDHIGRLPLLVKRGYGGVIYATGATIGLAEILLRDSAHLHERDTERRNRRRQRQGLKPIEPMYGSADVEPVLRQFRRVRYGQDMSIGDEIVFRFHDAGHILGSAIAEFEMGRAGAMRRLVMSGDIGPDGQALVKNPTTLDHAHAVVMESTYGDRSHQSRASSVDELERAITEAARDRGMVLIPAFAVGRSQGLLYWLAQLRREGRLAVDRVYLDSPMAITTTDLYCRHTGLLDDETTALIEHGFELCDLKFVRFTRSPEESMALNNLNEPAIVISASGMCTGGRILHHLKHHIWKESTHIIIAGFQGAGTTGRQIVDGAKKIRIHGQSVAVNAKVHTIGGFSAHAGRDELLKWHSAIHKNNPKTILVHGEETAMNALADAIAEKRHERPLCPAPGDTVTLAEK